MTRILLLTAALAVVVDAQRASAQLFASLNLNQYVEVNDSDTGAGGFSSANSTSVPFQKSISATAPEGGSASASYSVTENGTMAALDISASGSLETYNSGVTEGQYNGGTQFAFSQPVNFTLVLTATGGGELQFYMASGNTYINLTFADSTRTYSGTLYSIPGEPIGFLELWTINNPAGSTPTNQTGSDSINFTFYATQPIPEPSSAMLIGLPALALLARRPRPARRRIACRGTRKRWMSPSHLGEKV